MCLSFVSFIHAFACLSNYFHFDLCALQFPFALPFCCTSHMTLPVFLPVLSFSHNVIHSQCFLLICREDLLPFCHYQKELYIFVLHLLFSSLSLSLSASVSLYRSRSSIDNYAFDLFAFCLMSSNNSFVCVFLLSSSSSSSFELPLLCDQLIFDLDWHLR